MKPKKPTVREIIALRWELDAFYRQWHDQQREDEAFYNAGSGITGGIKIAVGQTDTPDLFDQVRLPTGKTIIDTAAEHASGNFPRLHVPRRRETEKAQEATTLMEKAGQGFWYRCIAEAPLNPLRAWAQIGGLRGAICASLFYNKEKWPELPSKPGDGASESEEENYEEAVASRKSSWPFELDWVDPLNVYPDPATEGKEFIIIAFNRMAHEVKRRWPNWDMKKPGTNTVYKLTDYVDFISYWDKTYHAYIIGSMAASTNPETASGTPLIKAYDGVAPHGFGFMPYYFTSAGYGMPTGLPEYRYQGLLTPIKDLLGAEMRSLTHTQAVIAQQAFPWLLAAQGVQLNMSLGGVTRVPAGTALKDAVLELRPVVPISELLQFVELVKSRIESATLPDTLGGMRPKGVYSGYHESILVGTGRARLRPLSDALEHVAEWATSGFFKLVENVVEEPVSVWGKGMGGNEFITLKPKDINGAYEVYVSLVPDLPQDTAVNISNGQKLFQEGIISGRDFLETYAGRENAEEILRERFIEDVVKSPQAQQQMIADTLKAFGFPSYTTGPVGVPGVRASGEIGLAGGPQVGQAGAAPAGAPAGAPSGSMAGIPNMPTPPGGALPSAPGVGAAQGGRR